MSQMAPKGSNEDQRVGKQYSFLTELGAARTTTFTSLP